MRNVLVGNDLEGVDAFDTLTCVGGVGTNALEEATEFVGVCTILDLFVRWMVTELTMFEGFSSVCIENREGPIIDEIRGVLAAYS